MPIDFYCAKCGLLMRMGDEAAGKEAKCPSCGAVTVVPGPLMQSSASAAQPNNPNLAPGNAVVAGAALPAGLTPTIIDAGDIMGRAWEIYKHQMGKCLLVLVPAFLIAQLPSFTFQIAETIMEKNAQQQDLLALQATFGLLHLVSFVFSMWIGIGITKFVLKVARGQEAEFSEIFSGAPYFLSILGASILFGLIAGVGFVLCIVPGIIVALMLGEFYFLIIDGRAAAIDSLKLSKRITQGNKLTLFLLGLIMFGLSLAGLLACGIGFLLVFPYLFLVRAVAYLAMTGQPTGDRLLRAGQGPAM